MASQSGFVKAGFLISNGVGGCGVARCEKIRRVHASGEEGFFIRQLGIAALLAEYLFHDLSDLCGKLLRCFAVIGLEGRLEVADDLRLAAVPLYIRTGRQLADSLIKGLVPYRITVEEILLQHTLVELFHKALGPDDLVYIAGTKQPAVENGIEHLLLTHLIADDVGFAALVIGYSKGERAVKMLRHAYAPLGESLLEYLRLALFAAERRVYAELFAQLLIISDISAEISYLYMVGVFHKISLRVAFCQIISLCRFSVNYLLRRCSISAIIMVSMLSQIKTQEVYYGLQKIRQRLLHQAR